MVMREPAGGASRRQRRFFEKTFIADSYSCQIGKGTHKALDRFRQFSYQASKNNTRTCWVLKGDIRKFFASIDQNILLEILREYIPDKNIIWLLNEILSSFNIRPGVGLPLGNLTSQLFVNIYMNEFDQFVKHRLKAKYYIRYADDFVILSHDKKWLENILPEISGFLNKELKLEINKRLEKSNEQKTNILLKKIEYLEKTQKFLDYILGPDGQKTIHDEGLIPAHLYEPKQEKKN